MMNDDNVNSSNHQREATPRKPATTPLELAIAAGKAQAVIDRYFEPPLDEGARWTLPAAYAFFESYFSEKGVRFDSNRSPLLPVGPSGDVDLEHLLAAASEIAMEFLHQLENKCEMYFEHEMAEFTDLGWRHGFLSSRTGDVPERWLVPVVLTLDLNKMELALDSGMMLNRGNVDESLPPLERLVAVQQPAVWARWKNRASPGSR